MFSNGRGALSRSAFAFLFLAGALTAAAQGVVRGTVTDPLGGTIKDAKVKLQRGDTTSADTTTNAEGVYTFSSVAAGRYNVQVEASGFANYAGPEISVGSGATEADVLLSVGALKEAVVVSATGSEMPVSQLELPSPSSTASPSRLKTNSMCWKTCARYRAPKLSRPASAAARLLYSSAAANLRSTRS